MYFDDMSDYVYYLKMPISNVKNIGWLDAGGLYNKGVVSFDLLKKLADIIVGNDFVDAQVNRMRSVHSCSLSGCEVGAVFSGERGAVLGAAEIWIPSLTAGEFFAAPTMIYHYIEKHRYMPPDDFISAIIEFDLNEKFNAQEVYLSLVDGRF